MTTLNAILSLAVTLHDQGKSAEAEPLFRENIRLRRKVLPNGDAGIAYPLVHLGLLLTETRRAMEAEPLLREARDIWQKKLPKGSWRLSEVDSALGACLTALSRNANAEPLLLASCEVLRTDPGVPPHLARKSVEFLVRLYESWDKPNKAAEWRLKAGRDKQKGPASKDK